MALPRSFGPLLLLALAACGGEGAPVEDAGVSDTGVHADAAVPDSGLPADSGVIADAGELDASAPAPTFSADVAPILSFQCQGCHFVTDNPPQILIEAEFVQMTYDNLVDAQATRAALDYIEPGNPDDSYLLHKVEGTHRGVGGQGNFMPPPQARRRVPAEDVALIRAWIEAGAPF